MPIYSFYKIVCKDENIKDLYVGKTTDLKKRWTKHKFNCNNENDKKYNLKLYKFIRENGNIDNWNIIEIDKGEYDDKDSAIVEKYWVKELNATLNCIIPSRTHKEYYENNKEIINKKAKEYRKKNIEKIKEISKIYRENNIEKIKEINKKITCECGCEITKQNLTRHKKTKKHIDLMI